MFRLTQRYFTAMDHAMFALRGSGLSVNLCELLAHPPIREAVYIFLCLG